MPSKCLYRTRRRDPYPERPPRILPADHWDLIGQIPGQRLGSFDHLQHYLDEARRLRAAEQALEL